MFSPSFAIPKRHNFNIGRSGPAQPHPAPTTFTRYSNSLGGTPEKVFRTIGRPGKQNVSLIKLIHEKISLTGFS
jgi:hypothetical protein